MLIEGNALYFIEPGNSGSATISTDISGSIVYVL